MVCASCKYEFSDSSKFCPRCGAKPNTYSSDAGNPSSDVPFFVPESERQTGAGHRAGGQRQAPYRQPSQNYQQRSANNQYANFTGPHYQQQRTFDDGSVRKFLIGFTIVAVAVVALVVGLVIHHMRG